MSAAEGTEGVQPDLAAATRPHRLYLVDGSGFIFRAFHALPMMTRPDGTPVNAVYGFANILMRLVAEWDAEYVAVVFDASARTFRNEIYPLYKAQRPPPPEELVPQFPLVREATRAFGLPAVEMEGYEADDLIATYARLARAEGLEVTVVSSDKDLMQLVGPGVAMLDPIKQKVIGPAEVVEKFGVLPEKVVDVQALAGDSVDNVPGIPGIGVKTAAQLIADYGSLEALLTRAAEIKQPKRRESLIEHAELARISKRLVTLKNDVPVAETMADFRRRDPDPKVLLAFLKANNFRSLLAKVQAQWQANGVDPQAAAPAAASFAAPSAEFAPTDGADGFDPDRAEPPPARQNYVLVQDEATLASFVERARAARIIAVDTETTGLDPHSDRLVGISMAVAPGEACYIPLTHGGDGSGLALDDRPMQLPVRTVFEALRDLFTDPAVLKVGHNIKFDMIVLGRDIEDPQRVGDTIAGLKLAPVDDSLVLSYVTDGNRHGHGMDELAALHLGHTTITFAEVAGSGKAQITFDRVPLDRALAYAAEDADITLRLWRFLRVRCARHGLLAVHEGMDRPLIPVLVAMEEAGVLVDKAALARLSEDFGGRLVELEAQIHALAGHPFLIASPKQLGEVLFEEMGLTGGRKTKTGAYSTDADTLEPLAAQGHAIVAKVLDWRGLAKLKSTYADALQKDVNPRTGRVHTSYALHVANTGRLSSNDPNLQNIPVRTEEGRRIRAAFVAPEGHLLLSVDYSQIELRLVAEIADVATLKQAFRDGVDIHALTASQVFGVPLDRMDSETRRKAKAINFGIIYGISGFGLSQQLGIGPGEAQAFIRQYLDRLPELKAWLERTKTECREKGYVTTLFGRRIQIPGIKEANPARRAFAERQAINAPIQGTAADIIKRAMLRVPSALTAAGLKARMLLQVHDELLFEVPEAEADATAALVRRVMEGATLPALQLSVPLIADAGVAKTWAKAH